MLSARFSRRELLIGLVYASIAIPGVVCSYSAVSKQATARNPGSRQLYFKIDRAAGTLYGLPRQVWRRAARERENPMKYWEPLGMARGTVPIRRGGRVWLALNAHGLNHPELLDQLEFQHIYRVSLEAGVMPTRDDWYQGLARFTGLRELDLRHAPRPPANLAWLEGLPNVVHIWLVEPKDAYFRRSLIEHASRAGLVEVSRSRSLGWIGLRRISVDK
jgi:hypothetical protein